MTSYISTSALVLECLDMKRMGCKKLLPALGELCATCHEELHRCSSSSSSLSLCAGAEWLLCLEKMRVTPATVTAAAQTPWGPERGGRNDEDKADDRKRKGPRRECPSVSVPPTSAAPRWVRWQLPDVMASCSPGGKK
ncbi:hypothetical protein AV530_011100 [Patagioenas fasciata monilis]|uniref:Uncharacterized protein n=1 Tax=Patagioenas fasciata monilis TaxID=372326 RepID=A0A1V4JVT7_PATFA|nr:hypothetical protein AV530_011100 [Patagioenas fasciata monilis]